MHIFGIVTTKRLFKPLQTLLSMSFHTSKSDCAEFKSLLSKASNVVFLTGAGCSAESGIPTFRGAGGLWRKYSATDLATPEAFKANPSLVWEFYSYRREVALSKNPNNAHLAIAEFEKHLVDEGRNVHVITQNIDGLHQRAGSKNVIELHGMFVGRQVVWVTWSLFKLSVIGSKDKSAKHLVYIYSFRKITKYVFVRNSVQYIYFKPKNQGLCV